MRARKFWISGKPSPPSLKFLRHRRCCMHYLHEMFSDKWILNLCYLYRATDEVHNSFDLVSFSTLPTNHPFFFLLHRILSFFFVCNAQPEDLLQGQNSNCAYKVKDCCQYPYIIPTYGTHSRVKYT